MIKTLFVIATVMLLLDIVYLYIFGKYLSNVIKNVQKSSLTLNLFYASIAYIFMISSVYYFGFVKKGSQTIDLFLLGFFSYGIYEFTNMATFKNFDIWMASLEPLWGGTLFATTYIITKRVINLI